MTNRLGTIALLVASCSYLPFVGQQPTLAASDPLSQGFLSPPASARPRVWWHWMNGNITREGVSADLDWMHRVGIAGFQNFDVALSTPKVVDQRLIYMTPGWKDAFGFAMEKGDALGMEIAVAGSPGWSESGGPWVTGRIVDSAADSDRFLWDYRRTIGELLVENHYGAINAMLHARGMGQYGESHESGRATIGDGMEMKRADDVPMAAMWVQTPGVNADLPGYNADIRESASVAHIYVGPFGQWSNRNETWAEQAKPWLDYLSRSSFCCSRGSAATGVGAAIGAVFRRDGSVGFKCGRPRATRDAQVRRYTLLV